MKLQWTTHTPPPAFFSLPGPSGASLTPATPSVREADAHGLVTDRHGQALARASLWWRHVPAYPGERLGLIGHYAAADDQAAAHLLAELCRRLAQEDCTLAVGPLDGSTFRAYRFVTERAPGGQERPPFFLEPDQPDAWPRQFVAAGFEPLAHYFSAWGKLPQSDPRLSELEERMRAHGITARPVDLAHFADELRRLYPVVLRSFQHNFLYTPIGEAEFLAQYHPLASHILPELALLAERQGDLIGFLFAIPDLAQARRGEGVDTVVIKTVGILPEYSGLGVGSWLVARCQQQARALGFRYVIHALMLEESRSRRISGRYAAPMRRYTLYARRLRDG